MGEDEEDPIAATPRAPSPMYGGFAVGDRIVVRLNGSDEGYHGSYYDGDVGTVVDRDAYDARSYPDSVRVDFDDNEEQVEYDRTNYLVDLSEIRPLNIEGQEPGLFEEVHHD